MVRFDPGVWAVKALKGKDKISLVLKAENFEMAILLGLQDLQRSLLAGSDLTEVLNLIWRFQTQKPVLNIQDLVISIEK